MVDDSVLDRQCIDPNDSSGWLNSSFPCPPQTRHGYLETSPNVDAVALRVTSPDLAEELYASVQAVKGLRPCAWTISNFPDYDDSGYSGNGAEGCAVASRSFACSQVSERSILLPQVGRVSAATAGSCRG